MRVCFRCKRQIDDYDHLFSDVAICEDCAKKVEPYYCARCGKLIDEKLGLCKNCFDTVRTDMSIAEMTRRREAAEATWKNPSTASSSASSTGSGCSKGALKFFAVVAVIALVVSMVIGFIKNGGLEIGFGGAIKFMLVANNDPDEYYGVSVEGQDNGWVAAFWLDNAGSIFCGEDPEMGEYYIIGSTMYLAGSDGQWEARSYSADTERILSRHLHKVLDGQYTYKSGEAWADGNGMTHTFDNDHHGGVLSVNSDGKITMYAARLNGDCAFDLKDYDFTQLKETAMQIMAEFAVE